MGIAYYLDPKVAKEQKIENELVLVKVKNINIIVVNLHNLPNAVLSHSHNFFYLFNELTMPMSAKLTGTSIIM